jgi:dCTP deaminase
MMMAMILGADAIRQRLASGDLAIEPILPDQIGPAGVELRLGPQLIDATGQKASWPEDVTALEVGEELHLRPGSSFVAMTLEHLSLPGDLAGTLLIKSRLARAGIVVDPVRVDPGFRGKLGFRFRNVGAISVHVRIGLPLGTIVFEEVSNASSDLSEDSVRDIRSDLDWLKATLAGPTVSNLSELIRAYQVLTVAKANVKGAELERFAVEFFKAIEGLRVLKVNARTAAEEFDVVIANDVDRGFWRNVGSPIVAECKNWSSKVSAREIAVLADKLRVLGPDAKMGVLFATNGITGTARSDATLKIRELRREGRYIVVLDHGHLNSLADGRSPAQIISDAFDRLFLL